MLAERHLLFTAASAMSKLLLQACSGHDCSHGCCYADQPFHPYPDNALPDPSQLL